MRVTFEEVISEKQWLHKELLCSLTAEVLNKVAEDRFYDVKLLVNGVELEPVLFNDLINGIEKYVDAEARELADDRLEKIKAKSEKLNELIEEAICNIRENLDL